MKSKELTVAIMAALTLTACSSNEDTPTPEKTLSRSIEVLDEPAYTSSIELTGEESAVNKGINEFSLKMFDAVANNMDATYADHNDNISISPLGIALALGMQANAVDDSATDNILKLFGANDLSTYNSLSKKLISYLHFKIDETSEMVLANSAWLADELKFNDSFLQSLNSSYNAEVYNVDFGSSDIKDLVDTWCNKKTRGYIQELPIEYTKDYKYVLINALYFNAPWTETFNKNKTDKADFAGTKGKTSVEMMHQTLVGQYKKGDNYAAIKLGYASIPYEMVVILPDASEDIVSYSKSFDYDAWTDVTSDFKTAEVTLSLPKFKLSQSAKLSKTLGLLGLNLSNVKMTKAGINSEANANVLQENFAGIDEIGTTIASVTAIAMIGANVGNTPQYEQVEMNINRPFMYFVRNTNTGSILMAGRICNI